MICCRIRAHGVSRVGCGAADCIGGDVVAAPIGARVEAREPCVDVDASVRGQALAAAPTALVLDTGKIRSDVYTEGVYGLWIGPSWDRYVRDVAFLPVADVIVYFFVTRPVRPSHYARVSVAAAFFTCGFVYAYRLFILTNTLLASRIHAVQRLVIAGKAPVFLWHSVGQHSAFASFLSRHTRVKLSHGLPVSLFLHRAHSFPSLVTQSGPKNIWAC